MAIPPPDAATATALLNKLTKASIQNLGAKWGLRHPPPASATKRDHVEWMLDELEEKGELTHDKLAHVDLSFAVARSRSRKWAALRISDDGWVTQEATNPTRLRDELSRSLSVFFKAHVYVFCKDDLMWIRIAFLGGKSGKTALASATVYLVHYPRSPLLLVSVMKLEHKQYVHQCVAETFGASSVTPYDLDGRNVTSLGSLILERDSQGLYSHYREGDMDEHPLALTTLGAPKGTAVVDVTGASGSKRYIIDEQAKTVEKRAKHARTSFGDAVLPQVERLDVQCLVNGDKNAPIRVRLQGASVLDGLREMVRNGTATHPLPKQLCNVGGKRMIDADA